MTPSRGEEPSRVAGVSADFLRRIEESGASREFVERLKVGGKPLRSKIAEIPLSEVLPKVAVTVAFASAPLLGGGLPLILAIVASGAAAVAVELVSRRHNSDIAVPPVDYQHDKQ
jgi:hypothetical protein